jgi:hypothetical protein
MSGLEDLFPFRLKLKDLFGILLHLSLKLRNYMHLLWSHPSSLWVKRSRLCNRHSTWLSFAARCLRSSNRPLLPSSGCTSSLLFSTLGTLQPIIYDVELAYTILQVSILVFILAEVLLQLILKVTVTLIGIILVF